MSLRSLFLACAVAAAAAPALAQEFPSRPVRFVVSFPAGGGVDIMGRLVATVVSQRLGQPVVVENRAGAAGVLGSSAVASAAPDGYTVLVTGDIPITQAHLLNKIPYDPYRDLAPLVKGVNVPTSVLVAGNAPFKTLADLLNHARANPGKVSWGTPGNGTAMHLSGELFKLMAKVQMVNIPYKGSGPAAMDTVSGQLSVAVVDVASALNIAAFNLGIAVGAWLGGVVVASPLGLGMTPVIGALLVAAALMLTLLSCVLDRRAGAAYQPA